MNLKYQGRKKLLGLLSAALILHACHSSDSVHSGSDKIADISTYSQPTQNFRMEKGRAIFDTLPQNTSTYKIVPGNKNVFIYTRSGVTMIDENDWEAKYTETLIFQVDTSIKKYNYRDKDLKKINCKYFWICLSGNIQKKIRNVEKGFIKDTLIEGSDQVMIDIIPEFRFGGTTEKDNNREIEYHFNRSLAFQRLHSN